MARGLQSVPPPGTRVRMTGYFLKATGQQRGASGASKWHVVACSCGLCSRGKYVAVDEPNIDGDGPRHIAIGNLEIVGKVPHSRDLADAPELVAGKKSPAQLDAEIASMLKGK